MQSLLYTIAEIEYLEIQINNSAKKQKTKITHSVSAYKNFKAKIIERVKEIGLENIDDQTIERLLFIKDRETLLKKIKNNNQQPTTKNHTPYEIINR